MAEKMKEAINEVAVEGIVSEYELRESSSENGNVKAGRIIVQSKYTLANGETIDSRIPIEFYAAENTKAGKPNSAYKSISTLLDGIKTLADGASVDEATKIRCAKAKLRENSFISRDNNLVTTTKISGSFFDKVKVSDFKPIANFKVRIVVSKIENEEKRIEGEMQETGALQVIGYLVQWNGSIDEVKFIIKDKKYQDAVRKYWNVGDTVNAAGYINFSIETEDVEDTSESFGEPQTKTVTHSIREYVIINGSAGPIEDGYDSDDVTQAIEERKDRIANLVPSSAKVEQKTPKKEAFGW